MGGTIHKLIERLTNQEYTQIIEKKYTELFMLTYRSFINPMELFLLIMQRFDVPPTKVTTKEEFQSFRVNTMMPIR
jgi:hypothetical protein